MRIAVVTALKMSAMLIAIVGCSNSTKSASTTPPPPTPNGTLATVPTAMPEVIASDMPPGVQPLPFDNRGCDPTFDNGRYLHSTGAKWSAYAVHGHVCLNDGRYADALPNLLEAVKLEPSARNLVALGVAYDGIGEFPEAREAWRRARKSFLQQYRGEPKNLADPIGIESAILDNRSHMALVSLNRYFDPSTRSPWPFNKITFDELGITVPFFDALKTAASGQPSRAAEMISALYNKGAYFGELRYARAIMLLAADRKGEARIELRLAARTNSTYSSDFGPYDFQWSAVTLLERLER
jgi:tetratricopeptide (TPR) repeat protein